MQITVEVPDRYIHNALAAPRSRYWALEAGWDPATCTGYVVDGLEDKRHELGPDDLREALELIAVQRPAEFVSLVNGSYDGLTGDVLLQFMAFGKRVYA
jgi:hypothetical protein